MSKRQEETNEIIEADRKSFDDFVLDPHYKPSLSLPPSAYRYLLIPSRLLEVVKNPGDVTISAASSLTRTDLVGNVYYWNHIPLIEGNGLIRSWRQARLSSYRILDIHLISYTGYEESPVLFVDEYTDQEQYRGKGIATSFYGRLRECAIKMGYRFIYGYNTEARLQRFFTEKLGRIPLGQTKPEIWKLLLREYDPRWAANFDIMTIDFLRPEDKEKYVEPNPGNPATKWHNYFWRRHIV